MRFAYRFIFVLFSVFCSSSVFSQKDFFGFSVFELDGTEYYLRWSSKTRNGRFLEEFLPKKEDMVKFERKAVVECASVGKSIESEVSELMGKLAVRKEQNVVFNFKRVESPVEGEIWIEYVQGDVQGGHAFTMEWNLARFGMSGQRAVMFRLVRRSYEKDSDDFLKLVEKKRSAWLKEAEMFRLQRVVVQ